MSFSLKSTFTAIYDISKYNTHNDSCISCNDKLSLQSFHSSFVLCFQSEPRYRVECSFKQVEGLCSCTANVIYIMRYSSSDGGDRCFGPVFDGTCEVVWDERENRSCCQRVNGDGGEGWLIPSPLSRMTMYVVWWRSSIYVFDQDVLQCDQYDMGRDTDTIGTPNWHCQIGSVTPALKRERGARWEEWGWWKTDGNVAVKNRRFQKYI